MEAEESAGVMVLRDAMEVLAGKSAERIRSSSLVEALIEMEDRPWAEWKRGKPMSTTSLARLLKPFGVKPRKLRFGGYTLNGYERAEIEAAHMRYCPAPLSQSGTPEQANPFNGLDENQSGTSRPNVPGWKSPNPFKTQDCSGVPVREGGEL